MFINLSLDDDKTLYQQFKERVYDFDTYKNWLDSIVYKLKSGNN